MRWLIQITNNTRLRLIEVLQRQADDLTDQLGLLDVVRAHLHRQLIVRIHPGDEVGKESRVLAEVIAVHAVRGHCRGFCSSDEKRAHVQATRSASTPRFPLLLLLRVPLRRGAQTTTLTCVWARVDNILPPYRRISWRIRRYPPPDVVAATWLDARAIFRVQVTSFIQAAASSRVHAYDDSLLIARPLRRTRSFSLTELRFARSLRVALYSAWVSTRGRSGIWVVVE